MTELKRNILNFAYGIPFNMRECLSHSFDRFYIVTQSILPTIVDIKISPIIFDMECSYLNIQLDKNPNAVKLFQNNTIYLLL